MSDMNKELYIEYFVSYYFDANNKSGAGNIRFYLSCIDKRSLEGKEWLSYLKERCEWDFCTRAPESSQGYSLAVLGWNKMRIKSKDFFKKEGVEI